MARGATTGRHGLFRPTVGLLRYVAVLYPDGASMKNTQHDVPAPPPRGTQDLLAGSGASGSHAEWIPWRYFLIFLAGTALVVIGMLYHLDSQRESIRAGWKAQIEAIAASRARLVENWLSARRTDGEMLAAAPSIRALVAGVHSDEALTNYLDRVSAAYSYAGIMVFDTRG